MDPEPNDDIDIQLVADSFRAVSDAAALDSVLLNWDRKLAQAGYGDKLLNGEREIRKQYGALSRLLAMTGLPTAEDPIDKAVGSVTEAAMVVSDKLRVIAINDAGRRVFAVEQGQIASLAWLDHAFRQQFLEVAGSRTISGGNRKYYVMRTRLEGDVDGFAEIFPITHPGLDARVTAVRELTLQWTSHIEQVLSEAFGLTPAETAIARLMLQHADIAKTAALRGVTVRSARIQLSQVFHKTETRTQVELVRLLALLGSRLAAKPEPAGLSWKDPLGREEVILRPDGRRLSHTWMGAENGKPALFVHGMVNGYHYPEAFEATLKRNGVKLLVVHRPGFGNCDANRKLDPCADHLETILHFCKCLGLANVLVVGIHSAVIPITLAAAQPHSPFSGILALGRFHHYSPKRMKMIAPKPRALAWMAINAPWAAEVIGRHGYRALIQNGVDWYIDRAYGDMPFDFQTTRRPEISALIRNACAFTFIQDQQPLFDDFVLRKTNIEEVLPSLTIPFHWMLGAVDVFGNKTAGNFYTPDEIETFLNWNTRITMEHVPEASELLPYQQPELVAQRICELA